MNKELLKEAFDWFDENVQKDKIESIPSFSTYAGNIFNDNDSADEFEYQMTSKAHSIDYFLNPEEIVELAIYARNRMLGVPMPRPKLPKGVKFHG